MNSNSVGDKLSENKKDIDLSTELSIGTITLACIGVTYGWKFYGALKINIFDYMQAGDFISLAFRNPSIVFFSIIAALVFQVSLNIPRAFKLALFPIAAIVLTYIIAGIEVDLVRSGKGRQATTVPCTLIEYPDKNKSEVKKRITPLGTAGDHFLYFSYDDQSTFILDKRSINRIVCNSE